MSITYTWKITGIKVQDQGPNTNAVVQTYWTKTGQDPEGNSGTFSGATPFNAANVPPESFIPFNQLTEEIVINWVKSFIVDHYEKHINEQIQKDIDRKKNPIKDSALPWAPDPTVITPGSPD